MYAIVDCNSFYCSCERLFRPDLRTKPVVVLSNNDGCIISRSDEAKQVGVEMAVPYFQARPLIERNGVATFSSNYNLYGDLSMRVMDTLRHCVGEDRVEVYSVDEAFVQLDHIPLNDLARLAMDLRHAVETWTGISVSIGVAPTKVLAKVANRLAKKHKAKSKCVIVLDTEEKIQRALRVTPVSDLWGVGRQYAKKLTEVWGIYDALQLQHMKEDWARKNLGGVVGARMIRELKGLPSIDLKEELVEKKMIATTRMFGHPVTKIEDIKEAVATYTSRAAEKLRRQFSAATQIEVFLVYRPTQDSPLTSHDSRQTSQASRLTILPLATSLTHELIKPALGLVESLYEKGRVYKKAGVILSGLVPDESIQGNLFVEEKENSSRMLMDMIDNVNFSQRDDVLKFASSGLDRDWKMRQELRSRRFTTRWSELCEVH
ncbi:MAG: Y-family DNA polymerase [Chitinophagaceae bacterium]|nr:Y-family DNA polymerase [Chitinophagaceae bacterium]